MQNSSKCDNELALQAQLAAIVETSDECYHD